MADNEQNADEFAAMLTEEFNAAEQKIQLFLVEFIQDLNERIIENTPYKTGFLRASWYAGINTVPEGGSGGTGGIASLNAVAANVRLGDVYTAVNGAQYAPYVEYGTAPHKIEARNKKALHWVDGAGADRFAKSVNHPGTAPRFFVRATIEQGPEIAQNVMARLNI